MGVCASIQHDSVIRKAHFLQFIDEFAFNIALEIFYFDVVILRPYTFQARFHGFVAINCRFAFTQQI